MGTLRAHTGAIGLEKPSTIGHTQFQGSLCTENMKSLQTLLSSACASGPSHSTTKYTSIHVIANFLPM